MKNEYLRLAESYESLAKSYRSLAKADNNDVPWKEESSNQEKEAVVDITAVRKVLAEKTQSGKSDAVKALLLKYGANKLSAIAPENFKNLLQEAEEL
ncbi:MAG: hypothetical protein Q4D26_11180 [Clostridia bacterium]|nr:hypothetical protein [Clostridia bacterium]